MPHRSDTKHWRALETYGQLRLRLGREREIPLHRVRHVQCAHGEGRGRQARGAVGGGRCGDGDANGCPVISWLNPSRTIDSAAPDDFDTLNEIHATAFVAPWSSDEQAALNEAPNVTTLVARRGNGGSKRPVGFITVRQAADEAEILTMAVHPRHRRAGVGRLLLEAALRHLYAERTTTVFLEVDPDNAAALALYRRAGFEPVGERPDYYASGTGRRKAVTMRLALEQPALLRG